MVIATKICGYNERFTWFRKDGSGTRVTRDQVRPLTPTRALMLTLALAPTLALPLTSTLAPA